VSPADERLHLAYRACQALAGAHYENFPVASWLVPAAIRPHVAAVYAFARTADDIADEDGPGSSERLRLLDAWQARLDACQNRPASRATELPPPLAHRADLVFPALADTIRRFSLPVRLFEDLLDAFRQDVTVHRYESWAEVDDYCRRSANPVGRLVLRLFGYGDEYLDKTSVLRSN
jgi:phytoene/squalene synthetase